MSIDTIQDSLNKEFMQKQDAIRNLASQEDSFKKSIDDLNAQHKKLSDNLLEKQSSVDNLDATIKAKNDEFEESKAKSIANLNSRISDLQTSQDLYDKNVKEYEKNVQELNSRKQEFENKKQELLKEIQKFSFDFQGKLSDISDVIKEA